MGSPNGIWTSVSGAMAQSQNLDTIANNLANVNTTGYKKDTPTFKEYLTAVERPPSPNIDIPRTIFKDSDFYHFDGREHALVNLDKVHTDHAQGNMKMTNSMLDVAIDGPAYFTVQTPNGNLYTRSGAFKIGANGLLVTPEGYPVLSLSPTLIQQQLQQQQAAQQALEAAQAGGQAVVAPNTTEAGRNPAALNPFTEATDPQAPPQLTTINVAIEPGAAQRIGITSDGQIFAGETQLGKLALAQFVDAKRLQKMGSAYFSNPDPENVPTISKQSMVKQGFIESSNVNPVTELVELLKANRLFESNMKAIKSYNDMAIKEANEVGKL